MLIADKFVSSVITCEEPAVAMMVRLVVKLELDRRSLPSREVGRIRGAYRVRRPEPFRLPDSKLTRVPEH